MNLTMSELPEICTNGIHYFKSIDATFYYANVPKNYTGKWIKYNEAGKRLSEGDYVNGKKNNGHYKKNGNPFNCQRKEII